MKRLIAVSAVSVLVLFFAAIAVAQNTGRLEGQVLDLQGKPYADVTVQLKNPETGQTFTIKSGKDGRIVQLGLKTGVYDVTVTNEKDHLNYTQKLAIRDGEENTLSLNFKEILARQQAAHPEETKQREDEEKMFKEMQTHFNAGVAAMNSAADLLKQYRAVAADQRTSLQEKRAAVCQDAVNEFQLAERGLGPKDVNNQSTVLANLGAADECAGHNEDAVIAFQKSIDYKPSAAAYRSLSTNLADVAVAQTDPKDVQAKLTEAGAACDKAITIDRTMAAPCWKNLGIVLSNKGRLKEAVDPLQKATQADPKDAQTWFLLGGALTAGIDTKTEGGKEIYIIPPGTAEAYQKCIDAAPTGPYAAQAQEALDNLAQISGGLDTSISKKKNRK